MRKLFSVLALVTLFISSIGAVTITPKSMEYWTCVDYSTDFTNNNPDWGIVTISNNQYFHGVSHMVNYKVMDSESIEIHDGMYEYDYELHDWKNDGRFYHFWINEKPVRNYRFLWDNRGVLN